jgi:hypothetical protein
VEIAKTGEAGKKKEFKDEAKRKRNVAGTREECGKCLR